MTMDIGEWGRGVMNYAHTSQHLPTTLNGITFFMHYLAPTRPCTGIIHYAPRTHLPAFSIASHSPSITSVPTALSRPNATMYGYNSLHPTNPRHNLHHRPTPSIMLPPFPTHQRSPKATMYGYNSLHPAHPLAITPRHALPTSRSPAHAAPL